MVRYGELLTSQAYTFFSRRIGLVKVYFCRNSGKICFFTTLLQGTKIKFKMTRQSGRLNTLQNIE